jgi:hypothetical protein
VGVARLTEAAFTRQVLALARLCGWKSAHFRPGLTRKGEWRTAVQGDGKGFPDLLLVRGDRVVVAELKTNAGKPTKEQGEWLFAFRLAGVEAYVWKPLSWPVIERVLGGAP